MSPELIRLATDIQAARDELHNLNLKLIKVHGIMDRLLDNFDADLENGVAWMNDEASARFVKNYPRLLTSIVEVRKYFGDAQDDNGSRAY